MTPSKVVLLYEYPCSTPINMVIGNGMKIPTLHIVHGLLHTPNDSLHLQHILRVHAPKYNLLSIKITNGS